jgi:lincosamide nucleotidyltransferase A/C/D/E
VDARSFMRRARVAGLGIIDPLYRRVKASRAAAVLDSAPLSRLRHRVVPGMGVREVLDVLAVLDRAGVPCWLVGGWGVDALLGTQTRKHPDVDLAIEGSYLEPALQALQGDGFTVRQRESLPNWMPTMIVLRDERRRWIELMVVDVSAPSPGEDSRPEDMRFRYVDDSFTTGSLDGHVVRCLAPSVQLLFHSGYPARDTDRHDVRLLTARFGLPTPDGFG